ncbi:MAG: hypothetical protein ACO2ZP_00610 [Bacteriovoracaceae bacterium]
MNEVEICNIALSHIGAGQISSLSENTQVARECKRHYPVARDSVLRAHPWAFARRQIVLAQVAGEEVRGWSFVYQYPNDCLEARYIYDFSDRDNESINFDLAISKDLKTRLILSDQENAELVYTAKVANPVLFDSIFIDAMSYRLASSIAIPIKGKAELANVMLEFYFGYLGNALSSNANEKKKDPETKSSFSKARA